MNDETPRRYRGSLLERAAEQYGFNRPATVPAPLRTPEEEPLTLTVRVPAEPLPEIPAVDPRGPLLRRGFDVEVAPESETIAEAEAPAPVVRPESKLQPRPASRAGRPFAPIDRVALREGGMLVPGGQITAMAEEFRMVKRQLLLTARAVAAKGSANAADHARMILICSAQPDEGKTFCAINLALSMAAEKDMEILLVDADFAKPDVLHRLGLPEGPGLLDALAGAVEVEDCIVETDVPQLLVLPAGTKTNSDTELLASDRARAILDGLAKANPRRIVIFDSPPALAASPAAVLAQHAGQVMLVVRADRTSEGDLREAVNVLDGCEHIQLLLNSVSFQPGGRRFGSYYGEAGE
ncbi:AAA family ATPase [Sphingomonas sp. LM7]|uniref:AAA family ATPase n=1 Tax=Sphingomonas sp. LM7 TaxID=1938607 RepID=UPI0009840031|nr:AAA family ATPase [Sphingomonas sp. LM7]AQR72539.1 exopolysaccharide biosynthesis protein [Sphingomonas sp. LM7]